MRDFFVWQFWLGLLIGYLLLGRLISGVRSKLA
jgi:hypothetical protein